MDAASLSYWTCSIPFPFRCYQKKWENRDFLSLPCCYWNPISSPRYVAPFSFVDVIVNVVDAGVIVDVVCVEACSDHCFAWCFFLLLMYFCSSPLFSVTVLARFLVLDASMYPSVHLTTRVYRRTRSHLFYPCGTCCLLGMFIVYHVRRAENRKAKLVGL